MFLPPGCSRCNGNNSNQRAKSMAVSSCSENPKVLVHCIYQPLPWYIISYCRNQKFTAGSRKTSQYNQVNRASSTSRAHVPPSLPDRLLFSTWKMPGWTCSIHGGFNLKNATFRRKLSKRHRENPETPSHGSFAIAEARPWRRCTECSWPETSWAHLKPMEFFQVCIGAGHQIWNPSS